MCQFYVLGPAVEVTDFYAETRFYFRNNMPEEEFSHPLCCDLTTYFYVGFTIS